MPDRVAVILKMLQANPQDIFLHYSLAMEYASAARHDLAVQEFRRCIELDGNYLAAYVEGGKSLRAAGNLQAAREMFQQGLELAGRLNQTHTQDYIRQQLETLP